MIAEFFNLPLGNALDDLELASIAGLSFLSRLRRRGDFRPPRALFYGLVDGTISKDEIRCAIFDRLPPTRVPGIMGLTQQVRRAVTHG